MTLYGMLDYGQGFDPLLGVKIAPVFFSVYNTFGSVHPSVCVFTLQQVGVAYRKLQMIFGLGLPSATKAP